MKKTLKKIFNIVWHVLVAVAFCGFIVLPFLYNTIDKTFGQWLWYPCLVIFLVYSFIPNKKMKEQSKYVQISSSGGILQLLFIISGIFVINYYDTGYNWYWFVFALIALSIPIGCVTVKVWAESKNTYSTEQVKAANVRLGKYIMFYWLLDLFYMACFNQWLVLQFVFGGLAMLIVFYSLTVAFLSEIKTNKWLLLTDFLLGIGLTVYLIYIIPNSSLQEILIPIISAVYGGLLTLVGVAWTIKSNNKDRKADLERIENERKEEERKKAKPLFTFNMFDHIPSTKDGRKICVTIEDLNKDCSVHAEIENSDKCSFEIKRLYHDKKWYELNGNTVILPNSKVLFAFNFNDVFDMYLEVVDSLGYTYYYELKVLHLVIGKGDGKHFHTIREIRETPSKILEEKRILQITQD